MQNSHGILAIDWRVQGLSERLNKDTLLGHVSEFSEYQVDLDTVMHWAAQSNAPKPWYILGHSMGGCIGLRALHKNDDFLAAAFTGPMWGINVVTLTQTAARLVTKTGTLMGLGTGLYPKHQSRKLLRNSRFQKQYPHQR